MDRMGADFHHVIPHDSPTALGAPPPVSFSGNFPLGPRKINFSSASIDFIGKGKSGRLGWKKTLGAKFEIFEVAKLWDKAFVDSRP